MIKSPTTRGYMAAGGASKDRSANAGLRIGVKVGSGEEIDQFLCSSITYTTEEARDYTLEAFHRNIFECLSDPTTAQSLHDKGIDNATGPVSRALQNSMGKKAHHLEILLKNAGIIGERAGIDPRTKDLPPTEEGLATRILQHASTKATTPYAAKLFINACGAGLFHTLSTVLSALSGDDLIAMIEAGDESDKVEIGAPHVSRIGKHSIEMGFFLALKHNHTPIVQLLLNHDVLSRCCTTLPTTPLQKIHSTAATKYILSMLNTTLHRRDDKHNIYSHLGSCNEPWAIKEITSKLGEISTDHCTCVLKNALIENNVLLTQALAQAPAIKELHPVLKTDLVRYALNSSTKFDALEALLTTDEFFDGFTPYQVGEIFFESLRAEHLPFIESLFNPSAENLLKEIVNDATISQIFRVITEGKRDSSLLELLLGNETVRAVLLNPANALIKSGRLHFLRNGKYELAAKYYQIPGPGTERHFRELGMTIASSAYINDPTHIERIKKLYSFDSIPPEKQLRVHTGSFNTALKYQACITAASFINKSQITDEHIKGKIHEILQVAYHSKHSDLLDAALENPILSSALLDPEVSSWVNARSVAHFTKERFAQFISYPTSARISTPSLIQLFNTLLLLDKPDLVKMLVDSPLMTERREQIFSGENLKQVIDLCSLKSLTEGLASFFGDSNVLSEDDWKEAILEIVRSPSHFSILAKIPEVRARFDTVFSVEEKIELLRSEEDPVNQAILFISGAFQEEIDESLQDNLFEKIYEAGKLELLGALLNKIIKSTYDIAKLHHFVERCIDDRSERALRFILDFAYQNTKESSFSDLLDRSFIRTVEKSFTEGTELIASTSKYSSELSKECAARALLIVLAKGNKASAGGEARATEEYDTHFISMFKRLRLQLPSHEMSSISGLHILFEVLKANRPRLLEVMTDDDSDHQDFLYTIVTSDFCKLGKTFLEDHSEDKVRNLTTFCASTPFINSIIYNRVEEEFVLFALDSDKSVESNILQSVLLNPVYTAYLPSTSFFFPICEKHFEVVEKIAKNTELHKLLSATEWRSLFNKSVESGSVTTLATILAEEDLLVFLDPKDISDCRSLVYTRLSQRDTTAIECTLYKKIIDSLDHIEKK